MERRNLAGASPSRQGSPDTRRVLSRMPGRTEGGLLPSTTIFFEPGASSLAPVALAAGAPGPKTWVKKAARERLRRSLTGADGTVPHLIEISSS